MSKIEEMALKNLPVRVSGNGLNDWDEKVKRKGYILGANAVLREIEKALDAALETCSIKDGYVKVREIIKELKGE